MDNFSITLYGIGGSTSLMRKDRAEFGANTTCSVAQVGNETIILDMGTGLTMLAQSENPPSRGTVLQSHLHYDHILGYLFYPSFFTGKDFSIYSVKRNEKTLKENLNTFMQPPFFPVPQNRYEGVKYIDLAVNEDFLLGVQQEIIVENMETSHPNGSSAFKIIYKGKSLVSLVDYEHTESSIEKVEKLCRNADLVLYDGMFTDIEYRRGAKGLGHSTFEEGARLANACNIKKIVFTHSSYKRSDKELLELENHYKVLCPQSEIGREGRTFTL